MKQLRWFDSIRVHALLIFTMEKSVAYGNKRTQRSQEPPAKAQVRAVLTATISHCFTTKAMISPYAEI